MNSKRIILLMLIAVFLGCSTVQGSSKQVIDPDVAHWVPYAFSTGPHVVTIKVPPGFGDVRPQPNTLPKREFDRRSEMYLLQKQYDYRSRGSFELGELVIWAHFTRLAEPLPTTSPEKAELVQALNTLRQKPMPADRDPQPSIEVVDGREWIHFDFGYEESFCTLLDRVTLLTVTASYGDNVQKEAAWFRDRKNLIRTVRDAVIIRD